MNSEKIKTNVKIKCSQCSSQPRLLPIMIYLHHLTAFSILFRARRSVKWSNFWLCQSPLFLLSPIFPSYLLLAFHAHKHMKQFLINEWHSGFLLSLRSSSQRLYVFIRCTFFLIFAQVYNNLLELLCILILWSSNIKFIVLILG